MNTGTRSATNARRASAPWPGSLLTWKRGYQDRRATHRRWAAHQVIDGSFPRRAVSDCLGVRHRPYAISLPTDGWDTAKIGQLRYGFKIYGGVCLSNRAPGR